jgi:hypothetical protein
MLIIGTQPHMQNYTTMQAYRHFLGQLVHMRLLPPTYGEAETRPTTDILPLSKKGCLNFFKIWMYLLGLDASNFLLSRDILLWTEGVQ